MPINRYQIRNVYSLADPELYKSADKDDPEALLEGVAMVGLVGVLRQLGDLAEFAAEIFHDLHEEVMTTAARGHGLLVRVQQLEYEIPMIERAFLSQTDHPAFFPNSGIDWHPNQHTTQNLITTGDLPQFVMDSYEECRGPPRLFLLDKFDVGGAGACLKRYTDPSIYKVEASSYDIESTETRRDKKTRKTKKKGSRWKRGETPEASQPSHARLHQLFLEEQVQTGAVEPARRVKLKKRPNKLSWGSGSYMNKVLNSPSNDDGVHEIPDPADTSNNGSRLEILEDNEEFKTNDGFPSDDVASETDNYMDALATIDSELETEDESGPKTTDHIAYSDANSDGNTSPAGIDSPQRPFACSEFPFHPRVPHKPPVSIAEKSQNMDLDFTDDRCTDDVSKVPSVSLSHNENSGSPKESEESEHSDILPSSGSLSSFSFIRNLNDDVPTILDTNKIEYAKENYNTDLVDSECSSPYTHLNVEEPSYIHDMAAEETAYDSDIYSLSPEDELKEIGDGILHSREARVFSYSSGDESGLNNPETEPVAGVVGRNECGILKEETDFEERETESVNHDDVNINDGKVLLTFEDFREFEEKEGDDFRTPVNSEDSKEAGEKEKNGHDIVQSLEDSKELEEKEGNGCFILVNSEEKVGNGCFTFQNRESEKSEEKEESDHFTLKNREDSEKFEEKEGNGCDTHHENSEKFEEKHGNGCSTLEDHEDSVESEEKEGNGYFTHLEDSKESEEMEGNGRSTLEEKEENCCFNHGEESEETEEMEGNGCFTLVDREDSGEFEIKEGHLTQLEDSEESEEKERNGLFNLESREDSEKSEEKEGNGCFTHRGDSEESQGNEGNGCFTLVDHEDSKETEEKEENDYFTHLDDYEESEEKEGNGRYTLENLEDSKKSEEKEGNGCFTHREDSAESEEREGNGCFTCLDDYEESEEKEGNGCFTHREDSAESEEKEGNGCFTHREDSAESEEREGNGCFTCLDEYEESEKKEGNGRFTLENHEDSEESEEKEGNDRVTLEYGEDSMKFEEKEENDGFTLENCEDSKHSREKKGNVHVILENNEESKESEEKEGKGYFSQENHEDSKTYGDKEKVERLLVISPDDPNNNVYSIPDSTCDDSVNDNPSLNSKITKDHIHSFLAKTDQGKQPVLHDLGSQPIMISPCDIANVEDKVDQYPDDQNDVFEAKFDHPQSPQLRVDSLTHIDHETPPININLQENSHGVDQVKHQSSPVFSGSSLLPLLSPAKPEETPPLPPLPPMQWRMRKLQDSFLTPTDGGIHSDNPFPPFFPLTPIKAPQGVTHSVVKDKIKNMDTEICDENLEPEAAVEGIPTSEQEAFWPSSLPPDVNELQNNIQPMKIRPRSPLIDAVAAHDKTKLRKVSDRSGNQMSKRDERDALLDQIRAKSFNLKPAVKPRPSTQGPKTNLRVAAILEKANAIRQAFAGSDDDDDDSDNWSDS